jgi:PilZ domain-containing protein
MPLCPSIIRLAALIKVTIPKGFGPTNWGPAYLAKVQIVLDRRRHNRVPTALPARILFHWQRVVDCTIRDLSVGGACIELRGAHVPDLFDVLIRGENEVQACRVAWRASDRMGVAFVQEA